MKNENRKMNWLAAFAAIPISMGIQMVDTPFNWLILVPIFYICLDASKKQILIRASIFGASASLINFFWLINSIARYSQTGYLLGIVMVILFALFFSGYASIVGLVYYYLLPKNRHFRFYWLYTAIAGGCLGVLLDWSMEHIGKGFATCLYLNYIPSATNIYAIQPAAIFGPYIITFFGAMLNYLVAEFIKTRKWKLLFAVLSGILIYIGWGALILHFYNEKAPKYDQKPFRAAVISANLLPEESWNASNGDLVARQLFQLEDIAVKGKANLAVWSETAVPWTYKPDDDFIHVVDSLSAPVGMTHLLGINTEVAPRLLYNSIYCINPGAKVSGRYDKRIALSLAEKPFFGITFPFLTYGNVQYLQGKSDLPLKTPYGNAGIILCNESILTQPAWSSVQEGANFLVNPGNDGWFAQTYLSKLHFYYARMRAVETRKDLILNNNNGYCGLIKGSGEIVMKENGDGPKTFFVEVTPNTYQPLSFTLSNYLVLFSLLIFIIISIYNIKVIDKYKVA